MNAIEQRGVYVAGDAFTYVTMTCKIVGRHDSAAPRMCALLIEPLAVLRSLLVPRDVTLTTKTAAAAPCLPLYLHVVG